LAAVRLSTVLYQIENVAEWLRAFPLFTPPHNPAYDFAADMNPSIHSLDKPIPIQGFPRVADKIAHDPDNTSTIVRRFDRLSARNLLFLEAQLAELEARQNRSDEQDLIAASLTTIECHSDWRKFEAYATERNGDGSFTKPEQAAKMELALEIKEKLNEYRKSKYMGFDLKPLPRIGHDITMKN
jgi:hypothetical protein